MAGSDVGFFGCRHGFIGRESTVRLRRAFLAVFALLDLGAGCSNGDDPVAELLGDATRTPQPTATPESTATPTTESAEDTPTADPAAAMLLSWLVSEAASTSR